MATATGGVPVEHLTCSICLEVFCSPTTLPCAHTFCRGCIQTYWDKGDINCPLCLTRFPQRPALSVNLIMESLASGLRADEPDDPQKEKSLLLQPDNGDEELTQNPKQNKVMCSQHKEDEMSLFCLQDNTLLCEKCTAASHKTHKTVPAVEQIHQIKKMLRNEKIQTRNNAHNATMEMLKAQMNLETLKESSKFQKEELEVDFSRLMATIIDVKGRLMASMDEKEKRLLQKTESKVAMMEATCKSFGDKMSNIDAGLKSTDPCTVLQVYSSLQSSLNNASEIQSSDDVAFDPEEKVTESRDTREQLISAVTAIWKDQGPVIAKALAIDCTQSWIRLSTLDEFKESLTFDPMAAGSFIWVSPDKKLARNTYPLKQPRDTQPEEITSSQVRASQSFTGGRHFWKVRFPKHRAYFGMQSDKMKWCVEIQEKSILVQTAEKQLAYPQSESYISFGIYLDYDSGILSMYGLRNYDADLLYSFTTSFSKLVLYPVFEVQQNTHAILL